MKLEFKDQNCQIEFTDSQTKDHDFGIPNPIPQNLTLDSQKNYELDLDSSFLICRGSAKATLKLQNSELDFVSVSGITTVFGNNSILHLDLNKFSAGECRITLDSASTLKISGDLSRLMLHAPDLMHQGDLGAFFVLVDGECKVDLILDSPAANVLPESQKNLAESEEIIEESDSLIDLLNHYENILETEPDPKPQPSPKPASETVPKKDSPRLRFLKEQYRLGKISLEELEKYLA